MAQPPRALMAVALAAAYPITMIRLNFVKRADRRLFGLAGDRPAHLAVSRQSRTWNDDGGHWTIGLCHGDLLDLSGSLVEVLTMDGQGDLPSTELDPRRELAKALFRDRAVAEHRWLDLDEDPGEVPEDGYTEDSIGVLVQGERHAGTAVRLDGYWAVRIEVGSALVTIVGRPGPSGCPEEISLVPVPDVQSYIDGSLATLRRMAKLSLS
jgi:hypothetical protein